MSGKLGVLIVHGMGDLKKDFADDLIGRLLKKLGTQAKDVVFEPCFWGDILQKYQNTTWKNLLTATRMDAKPIRKFIVSALGDAAGYLAGFFKDGHAAYTDIHERVRIMLKNLESQLTPSAPLIVLAHSLGSAIMSNYIWDEQVGNGVGKTAFEKTETMAGFITYGSNIPLFLPPRDTIQCIRFPSRNLDAKYKKIAKWINVYDPDDLLGYPLNTIWTKRNGTIIEDVLVNAGPLIVSETPFAHVFYNQTAAFQKIVIKQIQSVLATE